MTAVPGPARSGPRRGFTIIEILVVLVVLSVLAALGYARLQGSKDKATIASMTSDLRALAEEQEAYYFQNRVYSTNLAPLNSNPSPGNTVVINEATNSGWSGHVSNPKVTRQCYVVVGSAAPIGSATSDGVISCS